MKINAYGSFLLYWITWQHKSNRVARFPHRVIVIVIDVIVIVDKLWWNILHHAAIIEVVNESLESGTLLLVDNKDVSNADIAMENPGLTRYLVT